MIKIKNNTASREPLPPFLVGLGHESLSDLSWTDPDLGVQDCAWWPEVDASPALGEFERYGDETLTINANDKTVTVVRSVVPWSEAEIEAFKTEKATAARARRDRLLAETDWLVIRAAETGVAMTPEQTAYRQALRDITTQEGFPLTIDWPVLPVS